MIFDCLTEVANAEVYWMENRVGHPVWTLWQGEKFLSLPIIEPKMTIYLLPVPQQTEQFRLVRGVIFKTKIKRVHLAYR
jgi:hypothetical protein